MFKPVSPQRPYTLSIQRRDHTTLIVFPTRFVRDELNANPGDYVVLTFGHDEESGHLGFRPVEQGDEPSESKRAKVNPLGVLPVSITFVARQLEITPGGYQIHKSDDGYWSIQL